jgi:branched-chain amino acid transport system substrate-binding protein
MYHGLKRAISTAAVVIIVVILIVAAGTGVYLATRSTPTMTTTPSTSCSSSSRTRGTVTTAASSTSGPLPVFSMPLIPVPSNNTLSGTITIGVLDDLTDGLSSDGHQINASVYQAISDINNWLKVNDSAWAGKVSFKVAVEDYALDNSKAESIMTTFNSEGITAVVGPLNSGTAGALLTSYADADHIVMISPSSTSVALAIPDDYLFRTAPNDAAQGLADARMMYQEGVRHLIIVYRQDTYGAGLAQAVATRFVALGGDVISQIPYDTSTTDFSSVLNTINTLWASNVAKYGCEAVAIQAISFEELGTMLLQAKSSFPQLLNTVQPWYGSDGEAADSVLTNSTYASVMTQIELPSTLYVQTNTTQTNRLCSVIETETHITCDAYGLGAYDDVWLAALSYLHCGTTDGTCIQHAIPEIANESVGVTGPLNLEASGDRVPTAYNIWCVTGSGTTATWNVCGTWTISSDIVTWTAEPPH